MRVSDFHFDLPDELIAQYPPENRTDSRLLKVLNGQDFSDESFSSITDDLNEGDLVVLNNTKVLPARLHGRKDTGGRVEVLLEKITSETEFMAQVRSSRSPKLGQTLIIDGDEFARLEVIGRHEMFFIIRAHINQSLFTWFEQVGHMPLPPYITREDEIADQSRYQTVFAEKAGAVAAPTAGLHYDDNLIQALEAKGVKFESVTLHVGAGTYQPVRVERLEDHQMHAEYIEVGQAVCDAVIQAKRSGRRVMAVGTTVIRSLESAAQRSKKALLEPYAGETDIFIYPGYDFKIVDRLQTNFHLPESTLLMLVSAFSGYERIMQAYQHAIEQHYRFFSYGDAMLLDRI